VIGLVMLLLTLGLVCCLALVAAAWALKKRPKAAHHAMRGQGRRVPPPLPEERLILPHDPASDSLLWQPPQPSPGQPLPPAPLQ